MNASPQQTSLISSINKTKKDTLAVSLFCFTQRLRGFEGEQQENSPGVGSTASKLEDINTSVMPITLLAMSTVAPYEIVISVVILLINRISKCLPKPL